MRVQRAWLQPRWVRGHRCAPTLRSGAKRLERRRGAAVLGRALPLPRLRLSRPWVPRAKAWTPALCEGRQRPTSALRRRCHRRQLRRAAVAEVGHHAPPRVHGRGAAAALAAGTGTGLAALARRLPRGQRSRGCCAMVVRQRHRHHVSHRRRVGSTFIYSEKRNHCDPRSSTGDTSRMDSLCG